MSVPAPAPVSTTTLWPRASSRLTVSGVAATRRSPGRRSFGMAIFIGTTPLLFYYGCRPVRTGTGRWLDEEYGHEDDDHHHQNGPPGGETHKILPSLLTLPDVHPAAAAADC